MHFLDTRASITQVSCVPPPHIDGIPLRSASHTWNRTSLPLLKKVHDKTFSKNCSFDFKMDFDSSFFYNFMKQCTKSIWRLVFKTFKAPHINGIPLRRASHTSTTTSLPRLKKIHNKTFTKIIDLT